MSRRIDFDSKKVSEAFKAGNRARKKESAADTAEGVDIMEAEIRRFEKETGLKLEVRDGRPYYKGYLSIECSTMPVFLPQNLEVSNSLSLEYSTGLESLPDGLTVHGSMFLSGCRNLKSLPSRLFIDDNLFLTDCIGLTSLPADLSFKNPGNISHVPGSLTSFFRSKAHIYVEAGGDVDTGIWMERRHHINEAFKAGNRARKKETVQDAVESVSDIRAQIDLFKKQTGEKLVVRNGHPYYDGTLDLYNCTELTSLPTGLEVKGSLNLDGCTGLTSLPAGLKVRGELYLEDCTGLTSVPADLEVEGSLCLDGCTELTYLPAGLKVGDDLFLTDCTGLTSLSAGLEVEGNLWLRGCTGLTSLSDDLKVGGDLILTGCPGLTSLPSDLDVQGFWIKHQGVLTPFFKKLGIPVNKNGDTDAFDWQEWQKANGYIMEAFRAGNRARKKESVQDSIESVDSIRAQIDLFKKQTDIELEIKDGRPYFGETLHLENCTGLTRLPDGLKVGGDLDLINCTGLTSLPPGLEVEGTLDLGNCTGLTRLPDGLKIGGGLWMYGCFGLTSLPSDLVVQGTWIVHKGILTPFFRKLGILVEENGDTYAEDWREWQEAHGYLSEAFKAGNKARRKEAAQDTVGIFDNLLIMPDRVRDYIGPAIQSVEKMCTNGSWRELINRLLSEVFDKPYSKVDTYVKHENGISISTYYYTGRESHIMVSGNNGYVMRLRVDGEGHPEKFTVGITFYDRGVRCLRGRGGDKEYETVLERDKWQRDGYEFNNEGLLMFCQFLSTGIVPAGFAVGDVVLDEAFRAGNRARKKEAMQDAAAVTDSVNLSFMDTIGEIESFLCRRGEQEDRVMTAEGDAIDSGKWFDWRGRTEDYQALVIEVENIDGDTCNVYVYVDATGVSSTFDATGQHRMDFECTKSLSNRAILNNVLSIFDRLAGPAGEDELPDDLRDNEENWELYKNLIRKHADFLQPFLCRQDLDRLIVDGVLDEAFRAGNRARRKESVQDTVESADRPVTFDESLGEIERLIHRIGSKYKRSPHNNLYSKQRPDAQSEIFHIHPFSSNELTDNDVSRDGFYPGGWPEKVTHSYDAVIDLAYFPELDRTFVMMCANVCTVDPGDVHRMSVFNNAGSYSEYYMGNYMDKDPLRDAGDYDMMGSEFFYPVDTVSDLGRILEVVTYMITDRKWLACMALFTVCRSFTSQYTRSLLPGAICPYIRKDIRISPEMLHTAVNGALWNELLLKSHGLCGAIVDGRFTYKEILSMFEPEYRSESRQPRVLF